MNSSQSRVVRFHATGDASQLVTELLPAQAPASDEVRIRVEAIGLNRAEVMFRNGQYLEVPALPARIGYEAAGVVEAVGADVVGIEVGDRVSTIPSFSMSRYGVYGETAVVPAASVSKYPANLSPEQGASIWMQYLTAAGALVEVGNLQAGQTLLITAASSSVGLAAIEIARMVGATTIAATRTQAKRASLLAAGADHVVVTDEQPLAEAVMAITEGRGCELIFDPIGGPIVETLCDAAASGATIIEYGALAEAATPFPLFPALAKGLTIRGYTLFEIVQQPERLARMKPLIYSGLENGTLKPVIDKVFDFDHIQQAHQYMESNQQLGKIVVSVP